MKEMDLSEHLQDLRFTLIKIIFILFLSFLLCYSFGEYIVELLLFPLRNIMNDLHSSDKIVYLGIFDKIISQLQVAFWASILVSSPFWFYQAWKFIAPGLYEHEIKAIKPFIFLGFGLFIFGVLFGQFIVFPFVFKAIMSYGVTDITAMISLKDYLVLCVKILIMLGFMFQLPNVMIILGFMGLVTTYSLRKKRPYIYLALLIISAILTPPDVLTQIGLWIPLIILFEIGIWVVGLVVHPYLEKRFQTVEGNVTTL